MDLGFGAGAGNFATRMLDVFWAQPFEAAAQGSAPVLTNNAEFDH
jgi:hypothetical protein